ncbi:hypothetical protein C8J56DRAFT_590659 [Mycena floridula]|nr:hypothetical protein C8J56DRAFT_590659 [Mycena floridula]
MAGCTSQGAPFSGIGIPQQSTLTMRAWNTNGQSFVLPFLREHPMTRHSASFPRIMSASRILSVVTYLYQFLSLNLMVLPELPGYVPIWATWANQALIYIITTTMIEVPIKMFLAFCLNFHRICFGTRSFF